MSLWVLTNEVWYKFEDNLNRKSFSQLAGRVMAKFSRTILHALKDATPKMKFSIKDFFSSCDSTVVNVTK